MTFDGGTILLITVVGVLAYSVFHRWRMRRNKDDVVAQVRGRGWVWQERNDEIVPAQSGEPFDRGFDGRAVNVISGQHSGRSFASFDFSCRQYFDTPDGGTTTEVHEFAVWIMALPVRVAADGSATRALGRARRDMDAAAGQPGFSWRIDQGTLIAYQKGVRDSASIVRHLDTLAAMIEAVPHFTWHTLGGAPST